VPVEKIRIVVSYYGEYPGEVDLFIAANDTVLVSENVQDLRRLEAGAIARAQRCAPLIFTTDRQFPRGDPATIGRLGTALHALLTSAGTFGPPPASNGV
jgi:hypothetical protein